MRGGVCRLCSGKQRRGLLMCESLSAGIVHVGREALGQRCTGCWSSEVFTWNSRRSAGRLTW